MRKSACARAARRHASLRSSPATVIARSAATKQSRVSWGCGPGSPRRARALLARTGGERTTRRPAHSRPTVLRGCDPGIIFGLAMFIWAADVNFHFEQAASRSRGVEGRR